MITEILRDRATYGQTSSYFVLQIYFFRLLKIEIYTSPRFTFSFWMNRYPHLKLKKKNLQGPQNYKQTFYLFYISQCVHFFCCFKTTLMQLKSLYYSNMSLHQIKTYTKTKLFVMGIKGIYFFVAILFYSLGDFVCYLCVCPTLE